ncbi:MAG: peptidase M28, partial [Thermoplasmata archaeon]|nr:peptidase M28 [Thermoplasmata archaeon]
LSIPFFGTWIIATSVDVEATASDDSGVSHVEFYIDNSLKADDNSSPYSWNWDEKTFGQRTIKVVAYDNAGNTASDETAVWRFF